MTKQQESLHQQLLDGTLNVIFTEDELDDLLKILEVYFDRLDESLTEEEISAFNLGIEVVTAYEDIHYPIDIEDICNGSILEMILPE